MGAEVGHIDWLGYIAFAIVLGSLFLVILASILIKPRKPKAMLMVIGPVCLMAAIFIALVWVGASLFGIFVP